MQTCILIYVSISLFIHFRGRLEQKSRFNKTKGHFEAHAICDCGWHEILLKAVAESAKS